MKALLCVLAIAVLGCGADAAPRPDAELETTDVTAQPDATASLAGDVVAAPRAEGAGAVAGALPSDFPRDVPLPSPSSLVDFSSSPGLRSLTLESPLAPEAARAEYEARLRAAGFREDPRGGWSARGHALSFSVESFHGAARLTVRVAVP